MQPALESNIFTIQGLSVHSASFKLRGEWSGPKTKGFVKIKTGITYFNRIEAHILISKWFLIRKIMMHLSCNVLQLIVRVT